MTTFALVHGAWHGAWCWERLVPELERRGHRAIAVDLPGDDPDATFSMYADVVVDALAGETGDVAVVGHSLGGHAIPFVAERRPVVRLVYLCALLASPGVSFLDQLRSAGDGMLRREYQAGLDEGEGGLRRWVDFELAWSELYGDCDESTAHAAFERLRPQATGPYGVPFPLDAHPAVETEYVLCTEDRMIEPGWSRAAAPERLGIEPVELPGSHSPFLSRPEELALVLERGL